MKISVIAASILFLQLSSAVISQQPAKSAVEGTVVRLGTGDPISGVLVRLSVADRGVPLPTSATTDSQGKFELKDISPGSYNVVFAANGYAKQEFGQRSFYGRGTPITVVAGQTAKNINFVMTPAGNVSGHVRDSAGAPIVGIPVQLLRSLYNPAGQKSFQVVESERTNDRGEYRFYWISPGRYYVSAGPSGHSKGFRELNSGSPNRVDGEALAHTYSPAVIDENLATIVDVGPAAEVDGVDISMVRQRFFKVRGRVIDSRTGAPPPAVTIHPEYQNRDEFGTDSSETIYNASSGTFELTNMGPGSYVIEAYLVNADPSRRTILPIDVTDQDVDGVVLTLGTGTPVLGRVTSAVMPSPTLSAVRVYIVPSIDGKPFSDMGGIAYVPPPTVNVDGTFRIDSLYAGEYRLRVQAPDNFYLKAARFNQFDILEGPWTYTGNETGTLEIVVSSGAGQISGIAVDAQSRPSTGTPIVLIPNQHRDRSELYNYTTTDANGRYSIRNIPPGDYTILAWDTVDVNAWFDPDLVRRVESQGTALHIVESSNQTVGLKTVSEN
jgi:5-hydroxyisourate hydrolase-like protein (transthyretin family)